MKHIKTLTGKTLKETMKKCGCGEMNARHQVSQHVRHHVQ